MNEYKLTRRSRRSNLEAEQWTIYSVADLLVATILVVVVLADAEPPRIRGFARHGATSQSSQPQCYRPEDPGFPLPARQQAHGSPTASETPQDKVQTTEKVTRVEAKIEVPIEPPQFDGLSSGKARKGKLEAVVENVGDRGGYPRVETEAKPVYFVVPPPRQNYLYALQPQTTLVASPSPRLAQRAQIVTDPFFAPYANTPILQIY